MGTSLVEANQTENTEDLLYAEVSYDEGTNSFSFEMPEDDVALSVLYDQAEGGISTMVASDGDLWDDSTDIEANTYYYYSDGNCILLILLWDRAEMIPISISVTKQAERLIPSMHTACSTVNSPRQVERLIKIWSNWMKAAMTVI